MSLLKPRLQLIKLAEAAKILGCSMSSIREKKAGTAGLKIYRRPGSRLLFVDKQEVEKLSNSSIEITRSI